MAEEKFVRTESMIKARKELDEMTPEQREAGLQEMREKLRRYYEGGQARQHIMAMRGEKD